MRNIQFAPDDDIIDICRDNVFKAAFTRDNPLSQGALKRLISAYIGRDVELIAVNANEAPVAGIQDRQIRYDIHVKLDGKEPANVEMTLNPRNFEALRLEYYTARLFTGQDIRGRNKDYGDLFHTWQISLIGSKRLFPDQWGIHRFEYYDPEREIPLGGRTHIIVVELEKAEEFMKKGPGKMSGAEKWALFFRYLRDRQRRGLVNELLRDEEGIAMAGEVLLSISRDEVERARLESEYKYELDRQSFITNARREGLAEGKADALAEAARKMKQDGLESEKIRKYTQLSPEEIEKL
ncbi:MAG: Rpn family recombination-promoting nuclease/putative transposase [Treponema sp.]|jgi:predicted transposase/invertase (TIGR01784 family)|nr:Rpn family recombination-promoting nuclease/putative transposase [Treponema sp.]